MRKRILFFSEWKDMRKAENQLEKSVNGRFVDQIINQSKLKGSDHVMQQAPFYNYGYPILKPRHIQSPNGSLQFQLINIWLVSILKGNLKVVFVLLISQRERASPQTHISSTRSTASYLSGHAREQTRHIKPSQAPASVVSSYHDVGCTDVVM